MECPTCSSNQVKMIGDCVITNHDKPDESVTRAWVCPKCKSGGIVGYSPDMSKLKVCTRNETPKQSSSYRDLALGERICQGDEYCLISSEYKPVKRSDIGKIYDYSQFGNVRRPI